MIYKVQILYYSSVHLSVHFSLLPFSLPLPSHSAFDDGIREQPHTAEMAVDLDIEVEALLLDENEMEQLRQDTLCVCMLE